MLDDTLVVWAGEFGRTPMSPGGDGRDHHNAGFTVWHRRRRRQAAGRSTGQPTNSATPRWTTPCDVHDLHATMLRLPRHRPRPAFTVKFQGLDAKPHRRRTQPAHQGDHLLTPIDPRLIQRRSFLGNASRGLGAVALATLLGRTGLPAAPGVLSRLPLPQKARRVIWLTMAGGPSQPRALRPQAEAGRDGRQGHARKLSPRASNSRSFQGQKLICQGPQFKFARHGRNGTELLRTPPHLGTVVDDLCVIRSMTHGRRSTTTRRTCS
jgi:hypothetical protein